MSEILKIEALDILIDCRYAQIFRTQTLPFSLIKNPCNATEGEIRFIVGKHSLIVKRYLTKHLTKQNYD